MHAQVMNLRFLVNPAVFIARRQPQERLARQPSGDRFNRAVGNLKQVDAAIKQRSRSGEVFGLPPEAPFRNSAAISTDRHTPAKTTVDLKSGSNYLIKGHEQDDQGGIL